MAYKSKHGKLIKKCKIAPSDIFTMTDAWFDKGESGDGWVFRLANSNGRNCVNALFPKAHIEWRKAARTCLTIGAASKSTCLIQQRRPSTDCRWK